MPPATEPAKEVKEAEPFGPEIEEFGPAAGSVRTGPVSTVAIQAEAVRKD